ncbi:unnamed protein product [Dibothriocephalus latus]|uniref:Uncharacterized protein n=1 Tax=Dibothriocephalus latus TaxID=60516 RepID=A0A3P6SKP5_DIBLA|nr:unnamed protein product [Dibothriocephalus latus]
MEVFEYISLTIAGLILRIAISDKALIKEGELKCASFDGKASVLFKKLGRRKPESLYLILFDDLLMVTKRKKNDRYLVQDYCARSKIYVTIGSPVDLSTCATTAGKATQLSSGSGAGSSNQPSSTLSPISIPRSLTMGVPKASEHQQTTVAVGEVGASASANASCDDISASQSSSGSPPLSLGSSPKPGSAFSLRRSGSSLSSRSMPVGGGGAGHINRNLPLLLYVYLGEGQNGTGSELCFAPTER